MGATFTPNPAGIRAMLGGRDMSDAMILRAGRGKDFAESIAPVDTGQYRYGAHILNNRTDPGGHRRRKTGSNFQALPKGLQGGFALSRFTTPEGVAGARVTALAPYSRYLEWGTRYMRAQHILGRSLDAMR